MLDPKQPHRLTLSWAPSIAYLLKVPTVFERGRYRHALAAAGARRHTTQAMAAELRRGVVAVLAGDDMAAPREKLLEEIDGLTADLAAAVALIGQDEAFAEAWAAVVAREQVIDALAAGIRDAYPPYAAMIADNEVYPTLSGLVAAQMFLLGWEGITHPFVRTAQGTLSEESLKAIPELHLASIGAEIEKLLAPTDAQAKN